MESTVFKWFDISRRKCYAILASKKLGRPLAKEERCAIYESENSSYV